MSELITREMMKDNINEKLKKHFGIELSEATGEQLFKVCALVMKDMLASKLNDSRKAVKEQKLRQVHYMSMEFLVGRSLRNNAFNLGILETLKEALSDMGVNFSDLCENEPDPGLGNGGLGRLAACYMDSMATLGIPSKRLFHPL